MSDRDERDVEARFRSGYRLDGRHEIRAEKVRVVTLDALVVEQGLARVDFIKMDVDCYEAKVFEGARRTLERFRPPIFFEFGPQEIRGNGGDPEAVLRLLWGMGYRLSTEDGRDTPDAERIVRAIRGINSTCSRRRGRHRINKAGGWIPAPKVR